MSSANPRRSRPFISLNDGAFRLGDRLVFRDTEWVMQEHEHWAIIGPNGSGKSLLADGIRGWLPLVQGELSYHFRSVHGISGEELIGHVAFEDRKRELHGTVMQSRWNSLEELDAVSVLDFLTYDRVMDVNPFEVTRRSSEARKWFTRRRACAVTVLGLGPLMNRALLALSNGERQRVEIASVLCRPLRLLILDEPFAGLDKHMRRRFQRTLSQLMRTSLRVMIVTTRPEDLPPQITHVARVEDCRITRLGRRNDILPELSRRGPTVRPPARKRMLSHLHSSVPALIDLRHVTVRYGNACILRDLTWKVAPGESWAVLGPNGSGKSTLLSLILGDHPQAYANHVSVFGRLAGEGESIWEWKRAIGYISPELHLHFDENIRCFDAVASGFHDTIGLYARLSAEQRRTVTRLLHQFDLGGFADTPLFALSVGMQRMALLARALVKNPRLLVLDEPCQGLDTRHRQMFVTKVDNLIRDRAITAIYVTHRADEIPPSITHVLSLNQGKARALRRGE